MNLRYLPSLSLAVMLTIAAGGVFVVGFAYGYEADPGGPPIDRPKAEHAAAAKELPPPPLPGAMIEAHLAFLKTALKVTDAQTAAWNAVADVLRDQAKRHDAEIEAHRKAHEAATEPPDLPTILQDRQHMAVQESDDLSKLLTVLKPFYGMLSAEQKEIADHLFPPGHPGMGHGGPPCLREASGEPGAECQPFFRHEVR
ncbi:MAG TPA: Spy/CpxP family protein refolding chaperone [Alphaproteobacteria bacterium]|nr:Spy/CpxP family protein refolding chaperone [Alphaproteobacteria bacterium]